MVTIHLGNCSEFQYTIVNSSRSICFPLQSLSILIIVFYVSSARSEPSVSIKTVVTGSWTDCKWQWNSVHISSFSSVIINSIKNLTSASYQILGNRLIKIFDQAHEPKLLYYYLIYIEPTTQAYLFLYELQNCTPHYYKSDTSNTLYRMVGLLC